MAFDEAERVYRRLSRTLFPKSVDIYQNVNFIEIEHVWTTRDVESKKTQASLFQTVVMKEELKILSTSGK